MPLLNNSHQRIFLKIFLLLSILFQPCSCSYVSYKKEAELLTSSKLLFFPPSADAVTDGSDDVCLQTDLSLQIDMERSYSVSLVTIINHIGEYRRGLIGSQVEVSNNFCGPVINESMVNESAIVDVICNPPVTGQHVRIRFGGFLQFVHICEIRVYSDEIEKSECTSDPYARDYNGIVDVTSSGIICQKWTAVWPHISWYRFGDYNLCRNSDWDTAWCYTIDPAVRYRMCDVPETGSTCPRDKYEDNLQPLNTCNGVSHWLMHDDSKFASGVYGASEQPIEINVPSNIIASIPNDRRFHTCSNSFTLAFYIFPYRHSNGPIVTFGNTANTRFTIVQVVPNSAYNLYNSDIIVTYGNSDVLRTNVLLPETWTFLAITFDGQHKLLTVWRDGEIARIANTAFTSIDMDFDDVQFGLFDNSFDGVVAHVSWLQMYDRVLNEAEVKAAKNKQIEKCDGLFQEVAPQTENVKDRLIHISSSPTVTMCAIRCRHNLSCFVFHHNRSTWTCSHYQSAIVDPSITGKVYQWKQRI